MMSSRNFDLNLLSIDSDMCVSERIHKVQSDRLFLKRNGHTWQRILNISIKIRANEH